MQLLKWLFLLALDAAMFIWLVASSDGQSMTSGQIILGGVLVLFGLTALVKAKEAAGRLGADVTSHAIERHRAKKDEKEGTSHTEYTRRLAGAEFTPEQAAAMLAATPAGFDEAVKIKGNAPLMIPMYTYEQGLPGEHLLRADALAPSVVAQIVGRHIVFSEATSGSYNKKTGVAKEIARIPASAVRRIMVVDLDGARRTKKMVTSAANTVLSTINGGALHLKVKGPSLKVTSASIVVEYVDTNGILFQAVFKLDQDTGANEMTKSALDVVLDVRSKIEEIDKWSGKLLNASFLDEPVLSMADVGLGHVEKVYKIYKFLKDEDSAVVMAKTSAEMLATFTQNPGFKLGLVRESEVADA